ncbi:transmembrane protein 45B-like [Telopea speciosissima]|uniref:transmembrane protein 45B-like n=1 Tax=Telopea speciosissima TaxID=54955 RepID=UPI001CC7441D|nr:transmembrane protein 45B-like [Telopea speciosissima]
MGTLVGHVAPGFGFLLIGLWHLFNHTKLYALNPNSYSASPWFPSSKIRYLELYLIMVGSWASIAMELVIGPQKHQPFDDDGTIPSNHLHNFEHATISLSFFIYSAFAILLDRIKPKAHYEFLQLLGAYAFTQQFLLFHLHSADHIGIEGQYHLLLQVIILVSLFTTLMGITHPKSFLVSFIRSLSICFQGVWFVFMGFMLWTPGLIPKGCFLNLEEGHLVVRCKTDESLHRAKSLVNLQFSWFFAMFVVFAMVFYLGLLRNYPEKVEYWPLEKVDEDGSEDLESQKRNNSNFEESKSFFPMGKDRTALEMER